MCREEDTASKARKRNCESQEQAEMRKAADRESKARKNHTYNSLTHTSLIAKTKRGLDYVRTSCHRLIYKQCPDYVCTSCHRLIYKQGPDYVCTSCHRLIYKQGPDYGCTSCHRLIYKQGPD